MESSMRFTTLISAANLAQHLADADWVVHESVAVLDGGLPAWQAQNFGLSTSEADAAPGNLSERPPLAHTVDVGTVLANLNTQARTVLDARAPDRFRGENETLDPVGG